jgi:hypothetical protein
MRALLTLLWFAVLLLWASPSSSSPGGEKAEPLPVIKWGARATSVWDGSYNRIQRNAGCESPLYRPDGPDTQVVWVQDWGSNGLVCPGTCDYPTPVTVKNGVATVSFVWVEQDLNKDPKRGYKLTYQRSKVEVPLAKSPYVQKEAVGGVRTVSMPARTWREPDHDHAVDQVAVQVSLLRTDDPSAGKGRYGQVDLYAGHAGRFFQAEGLVVNCKALIGRSDFKLAPGGDDGDDTSSTSSSSSGGHDDHGAQRKCKAQCRQAAGSCRSSCRGSAKCANDCNHEESACERGC